MTINCKGLLIDLSTPKIMGILNSTPNSFFDGGKYPDRSALLGQVSKMLDEGADFIDIGGYSSKPNAEFVSAADEENRVVPVINEILEDFPHALISVDTFRASVAKSAVEAGAALVNDISAGHLDEDMLQTVANLKVPYIMMHMRGNPQTMQQQTSYDDIIKEMLLYFSERIAKARSFGIDDLIIDPGFGFAKTTNQNYEVMQNLELLLMTELPMLIGVSRKSMIYKVVGGDADSALNGTTALNMTALSKGAKILRVHDVKEAMECINIHQKLTI
ncbi:MAG TPA: dihydropteroate synthase [Flavobacterium sp.]